MKKDEFQKLCKSFKASDYLKLESFIFIGKKFLSTFSLLKNNVYHNSFDEVREELIQITNDSNFPENENDFYSYLCKKYLKLKSLPMKNIIEDYFYLINNIQIIDQNIKLCESEKEKLKEKKKKESYLNSNENYLNLRLDYLIQKYKNKKDKKIDFLINKLPNGSPYVKRLYPSSEDLQNKIMQPVLIYYTKEKKLNLDDIQKVDEITCKFLNFPPDDIENLKSINNNNNKLFRKIISDYISSHKVNESIEENVSQNHFLHKKSEEFKKILDAYSEKDYFTFNNLVPLFIEGLFYDICMELGATKKDMIQASLKYKLDFINKKISLFIEYEYFAFAFPILRNKIAHGDLKNSDNDYLANMLLLDLFSVVSFCNADELPMNQYRKDISRIYENPKLDRFFYEYTKDSDYFDKTIDSFYKEAKELEELKKSIKTEEYLNYLETWNGEPNQIKKILIKLKKDGFEKEKITELLQKMGNK